jgi:ABC-type multidrug transport system ATPase subunit
MDEAMLCDRIALMQKGTMMTIDTPQGIIDRFPQKVFAAKSGNMSRLLDDLRGFASVKSCHTFGEYHHLTMDNEQLTMDNLRESLMEAGHANVEIKEIEPTIEDCFMGLSER